MSSDAVSGRGDLPRDDVPAEPTGALAGPGDASGAGAWNDDFDDVLRDPATTNWFSAEIENVSTSDWDIDTAQIWGDDSGSAAVDDGDPGGLDFPL